MPARRTSLRKTCSSLPARHPALQGPRAGSGFTLIELAVGLFILTLILGALLGPLGVQVEQRKSSETQRTLDQISEALFGAAVTNGYLPCPDRTAGGAGTVNDTANDGVEDFSAGGTCAVAEGNLPWATLGVGAADAWGHRFRYRVTLTFAQRAPAATFTLANAGTLTVTCPAPGCAVATNYTTNAAAVVLSHGPNGWGSRTIDGNTLLAAPTSADELANTDIDSIFVSRTATASGSTAGEFDDLVLWVPTSLLFNRMVAAQKLP
jgi:type II secretory pathway pseudopilin PulG